MNSIEDQIREINWKNPNEVIDFYESNALYYNNYQNVDSTDKINDFLTIKLHYANSLFDNSRFAKVTEVLEQVRELLNELGKDHWNYEQSERHERFLTGMVLGKKQQFKASHSIFKRLVKEDPEHYYYQVWYDHTRIGLYNWLFNLFSYGGLALILLDLVFELDEKLTFDPGLVGLVLATFSFLTQKGISEYYKKKKAANKR
ncbi:MAG: hypothetical protein ABJ004_13095 [Cyclobacteriaceae bacterium]